jgi:hypothetical protein
VIVWAESGWKDIGAPRLSDEDVERVARKILELKRADEKAGVVVARRVRRKAKR